MKEKTVLLAEDDASIRLVVSQTLVSAGYQVRAALAGHRGAAHTGVAVTGGAEVELPDLVLLTLDGEMAAAARRIGLPLHPAACA